MNENIDLTKILEGCPEGTEFYSSVFGNVRFVKITLFNTILMMTTTTYKSFAKDGRLYDGVGECTLFPSKDQRDWSKFERFWDKSKVGRFDPKTLEPYDRVLVRDATSRCWKIDFYGYNRNRDVGLMDCASGSKPYCIP